VALILLTNDDGFEAEGLRQLQDALEGLADLLIVAPDRERSAVSHGLTIHSSLELNKVDETHYTLNGTPADCILQALANVSLRTPDLVISGINHGANLGEDIMYSGTVAAAREASRRGITSLAVSQAYEDGPIRFKEGAKFVRNLIKKMLAQGMNGGLCLNINIPVRKVKGVKITRQSCAPHFPHFNALDRTSPASASSSIKDIEDKTSIPLDYEAILDNYVSVTPLQRDQTDYAMVDSLLSDDSRLFSTFRLPGIGLIR
jgi:5'-nucleotidase